MKMCRIFYATSLGVVIYNSWFYGRGVPKRLTPGCVLVSLSTVEAEKWAR